ncbi:hypothetical protein [Roseicyclus marinus]|uniref:hypothetical protein n=1 Tax=Roseicyclus marinus TaxID=2161673 RepID=UPI00240F723E|nr:hypothetical protein [Roseicyclus marinus]MDG3040065.1 hypothetical protein [Roseicyclus marinus]
MNTVSIETFDTATNKKRTEYRDTILFMLNAVNVNFILLRATRPGENVPLSYDQLRVASAHILSAIATGKTISTLLNPLSICSKDALPLARTFYECILNASFVLTDKGVLAERASKYTIYKLFKKQKNFFDFGVHKGLVKNDFGLRKNDPLVADALSIFEKKAGGGLRPCFTENRSEKIRAIERISPGAAVLFNGIEAMSWDLASEIAHGSHFSFDITQSNFSGSGPFFGPEEIGAFATYTMVCSIDAYLRVLRSIVSEVGGTGELSEACILFYQEEVPELANSLENLTR